MDHSTTTFWCDVMPLWMSEHCKDWDSFMNLLVCASPRPDSNSKGSYPAFFGPTGYIHFLPSIQMSWITSVPIHIRQFSAWVWSCSYRNQHLTRNDYTGKALSEYDNPLEKVKLIFKLLAIPVYNFAPLAIHLLSQWDPQSHFEAPASNITGLAIGWIED